MGKQILTDMDFECPKVEAVPAGTPIVPPDGLVGRCQPTGTVRLARPEVEHVQAWLDGEREYGETKWPPSIVDEWEAEEFSYWVTNYLHQAQVLGVGNPLGRQRLAKATRTLLAMLESNVRQYGPLPAPGVPSGQL